MKKVKIAIIGTRGIPASYGGFETFAEEVAVRLVKKGVETIVVCDKKHGYEDNVYEGVELYKSRYHKPKNPLGFYGESLKIAKKKGANFILMCGVGGSMLIPFYNDKKLTIAVNPDGLGFLRDKYVWWKKKIFLSQYYLSSKLSPHMVFDSVGIENYFKRTFKRNKQDTVVEYGTYLNKFDTDKKIVQKFDDYDFSFKPFEYHLIVSRLEPENNVKMIVEGYLKSEKKYPLIVVGNTNTKHSEELLMFKSDSIQFIEGVYDRDKLMVLRAGCLSYLHGHSVGGTNPSLLEATGSKNLCICHDNIFNREVLKDGGIFFKDSNEVNSRLNFVEDINNNEELKVMKNKVYTKAASYYTWENITQRYLDFALQTI